VRLLTQPQPDPHQQPTNQPNPTCACSTYANSSFFAAQQARIAAEEQRVREDAAFGHPDFPDSCTTYRFELVRIACTVTHGLLSEPHYSKRPRPGIIVQTLNWMGLLFLLNWRRGGLRCERAR
jgi:hypothetical protein